MNKYHIKKKNGKKTFFCDNKPITKWFDEIYPFGLVSSEIDYYIIEQNKKEDMFHKNNKDKVINSWFNIDFIKIGLKYIELY